MKRLISHSYIYQSLTQKTKVIYRLSSVPIPIPLSVSYYIKLRAALLNKLMCLISAGCLILSACTPVPTLSLNDRTQTTSIPVNYHQPTGELQNLIIPDVTKAKYQGQSGVYMLDSGKEAFIARLALIKKATHSIDAQYYIWHDDISGRLLLNSLYEAANRGVRVRLLLDDNSTKSMDVTLNKLDKHKNIEVRLFNPYRQRQHRSLGYFTDTRRINRRMHNKSFTVDGVISIIGGRNIGDEYFEVTDGKLFADLDVSLVGKVVPEIATDFDRYWLSQSSYPISYLINSNKKVDSHSHDGSLAIKEEQASKNYLFSLLDNNQYQQYLQDNRQGLVWANTQYYSDPPNKAMLRNNLIAYRQSVIAKVLPTVHNTKEQLIIISPYFVPTQSGVKQLIDIAKQGKKVIVITNSLSSTDVPIVHSGYRKYRKQLLKAGIDLYEFKVGEHHESIKNHNKQKHRLNGILPDSNASLHAKVFTIDNRLLFVGSPNLDPRSAHLNTELGVLIDSDILVRKIKQILISNRDHHSYRLSLTDTGELQWHSQKSDGNYITYTHEPEAKLEDRVLAHILSLIPLEGWL